MEHTLHLGLFLLRLPSRRRTLLAYAANAIELDRRPRLGNIDTANSPAIHSERISIHVRCRKLSTNARHVGNHVYQSNARV